MYTDQDSRVLYNSAADPVMCEGQSRSLTHIYMTAHFPGLVQALQWT